jgi:RNA polymerase sigma factor (sigma-70 family)
MDLLSLVPACCQNDPQAWELFFPSLSEISQRTLRTFRFSEADQEDILSQSLIKLINGGLLRFHGKTMGELVSYLKQIIRNEALTYLKRSSRERPDPDAGMDAPADPQSNPAISMADDECLRILDEMVQGLPVQEKELYLMKFRGLKEREIAEQTKTPPGTVAARIKRLLDKIRAYLRKEGC